MTDVHKELKKTNKAVKPPPNLQPPIEFKLPFFITNTDWRTEFYDGVDWVEAAAKDGFYKLGVVLCVVIFVAALAGFAWALITH